MKLSTLTQLTQTQDVANQHTLATTTTHHLSHETGPRTPLETAPVETSQLERPMLTHHPSPQTPPGGAPVHSTPWTVTTTTARTSVQHGARTSKRLERSAHRLHTHTQSPDMLGVVGHCTTPKRTPHHSSIASHRGYHASHPT